jgi:hypothetical protein
VSTKNVGIKEANMEENKLPIVPSVRAEKMKLFTVSSRARCTHTSLFFTVGIRKSGSTVHRFN